MNRAVRAMLTIVSVSMTIACVALPSTATTTPPVIPTAFADTETAARIVDVIHPVTTNPSSTSATSAPTAAQAASTQAASAQASSQNQTIYVEFVSATAATGDDVNQISRADAQALVASINTYWSRQSEGAVGITFAGFETSSLNHPTCDPSAIYSSVPDTAFGGQFDNDAWRGTGKHLLILTAESCGGDGEGTVGGNGGIMLSGDGSGAALGQPIAFHEFGHNLGFGHAGSAICRSNVTEDGAASDFADENSFCATDEYGDFLDIMGYSIPGSAPHLSSAQRIHMGWLSDHTRITDTVSTTTTIVTSLDGAAGNRAVSVVDPNTGSVYYVEYRTGSGFDATSTEFTDDESCVIDSGYEECSRGVSASTGSVRILRELPYANSTTSLRTIVMAAGSTDSDTARATHLNVGDTFSSVGGIYITLNSIDPNIGASVTVRFSPPASTTTSVVLTSPNQPFGSKSPAIVHARVEASDDLPTTGTVTFDDGKVAIGTSPVSGGIASLAIAKTLAIGTHKITAHFTPATGDQSPSTGNVATFVVTKKISALTVTLARHSASIRLTVAGIAAHSGTVTVHADGHFLKKVSIAQGATEVAVPKDATTLVVEYAGTKHIAPAEISVKREVKH